MVANPQPRTTPVSKTESSASPARGSGASAASSARVSGESERPLALDLWTRDLTSEHGYEPLRVDGWLPEALHGTLYRNGPGQFGLFGRRYAHAFEGDGAITSIRMEGGKAFGAARVTETAGLREERAAGKMLFGTAVPWAQRVSNMVRGRRKNTANTSVVMWQDRLFALMEGAKPTELNPADLSMIGETDLDVITGVFSAHPHRVESRKAIYNFGLRYGKIMQIHMYELPDVGAARHLGAIDLAGLPMLHDFIATSTHLIFFVSPVRVSLPRALLQVDDFKEMFRWKPELGTEVICVPIDRPSEPVRFTVDSFYQWHFANAFTRGESLIVDYVRYPNFTTFDEIGTYARDENGEPLASGRYHRATIDLNARTLRSEELSDRSCEFPSVKPAEKGSEHALAFAAFDELGAIGSIDHEGNIVSHDLPSYERATEPLYADGYLLSLCHERERAFLAVYDPDRIPDGPIAKVWLDHHVPITFHGVYAPGLV